MIDMANIENCIVCGKDLPIQNKLYCSRECYAKDKRLEHKIVDGVECKYCNSCQKWYSLNQFTKGKEWDGLREICKHCISERRKTKDQGLKHWSKKQILDKIYRTYIKSAKDRGLIFDLDRNAFEEIISKECEYCGTPPIKKVHKSNNRKGTVASNGIDRVDNNLGYIENNCVPCCTTCNKMKLQLSKESFIEHISKIYNNYTNER